MTVLKFLSALLIIKSLSLFCRDSNTRQHPLSMTFFSKRELGTLSVKRAGKIIILLVGLLLEFICKMLTQVVPNARLRNRGHLNMIKLIFQPFNTLVGARGIIATYPI